jgi:AcrR family transcriptional regulator
MPGNGYRFPMAGRREQLRATLLQSIREAALAELRRVGPTELSLREVARLAEISPSGLYRYVEGRDGLLELLIADGFERFGSSVGAAIAAAGPLFGDQVEALARAYRSWARTNPEQFALILGSPVVGFRPSPDGPTGEAVRHFGMPMLRVILDAAADGQLVAFDTSHATAVTLDPELPPIPADLLDMAMRSWGRIHGLVILEAFGHLNWTGQDVETTLSHEAKAIAESFSRPARSRSKARGRAAADA